jgi:hypothetical protein
MKKNSKRIRKKLSKQLIFLSIIIILLNILISFGVTGENLPPRSSLSSESAITINGSVISVIEVANEYKPNIYVPQVYQNHPFIGYVFDVYETQNSYIILYRIVWKDEDHPNPVLDVVYDYFRSWYYGSTFDIEPIIIEVSKSDAEILSVEFETEANNDSTAFIPSHLPVLLNNTIDGTGKFLMEKSGSISEVTPNFDNQSHLVLTLLSWNHLFYLPTNNISLIDYQLLGNSLIHMPRNYYSTHNLARRSALRLSYSSDWLTTGLIIFGMLILEGLLIIIFSSSYAKNIRFKLKKQEN